MNLKATKTKKSFGQHWLFDQDSLQAMLSASEVDSSDTVLEVGPGLGSLTELLAQKAKKVIAIEKDSDLINSLNKKFSNDDNVEILNQDILGFDLSQLNKNYKVVANIPYYLTGKLIRDLITSSNPPSRMALLVQKEVAERIVAQPKEMSLLAFSVQFYYKAELNMIVKKELFKPQPKVDSAIVSMSRLPSSVFEADDKKLFQLVRIAFSQKRKTLRNSLAAGFKQPASTIEEILLRSDINLNSRAQELSFDQWQSLYIQFTKSHLL